MVIAKSYYGLLNDVIFDDLMTKTHYYIEKLPTVYLKLYKPKL